MTPPRTRAATAEDDVISIVHLDDAADAVEPTPGVHRGGRLAHIMSAGLSAVFIWWAATAVLVFFNFIPGAQPWIFTTSSVLAAGGVIWLLRNPDTEGVPATYLAFAAGLFIWTFAESSFYSGVVTGLDLEPIVVDGPSFEAFVHVVGLTIWRELLALGIALVALYMLQIRQVRNPFGWQVVLVFYGSQLSAKLNVFLGVANPGKDFIPDPVANIRPFMTEGPLNPLFPITITVLTLLTWVIFSRSLDDQRPRAERIGHVLVGTIAALALLEHWFLVIPF